MQMNNNKRKSSPRRRTASRSRRRTSMDSFLFYPARPSFLWSFSADSDPISSFSPSLNPYPPSNPSILSVLFHQEIPSIPQSSFSQDFSAGPGMMFPHPPAQLVEDLSVWSRSHTSLSLMAPSNLFALSKALWDIFILWFFLLFLSILLMYFQINKILQSCPQFSRFFNLHPCLSKIFPSFILLVQPLFQVCRGFVWTSPFHHKPQTQGQLGYLI